MHSSCVNFAGASFTYVGLGENGAITIGKGHTVPSTKSCSYSINIRVSTTSLHQFALVCSANIMATLLKTGQYRILIKLKAGHFQIVCGGSLNAGSCLNSRARNVAFTRNRPSGTQKPRKNGDQALLMLSHNEGLASLPTTPSKLSLHSLLRPE